MSDQKSLEAKTLSGGKIAGSITKMKKSGTDRTSQGPLSSSKRPKNSLGMSGDDQKHIPTIETTSIEDSLSPQPFDAKLHVMHS